jgi:hypothetical protein
MNMDWIMSPLTMYGTVGAAGTACLFLVLTSKMEMARYAHRYTAEKEQLERSVAGLTARVEELAEDAVDRPSVTVTAPATAVSLNKRAEALRMYRRGADANTIAATVGLTTAEVTLLGKIHRILNDGEQSGVCAG